MTEHAMKRHPMMGHVNLDASAYDDATTGNIDLIRRRSNSLAGSFLFYHDPLQVVRGRDVWLFDEKGRRYLDCYNNVPCVGHCHPAVVRAMAGQARILNTHTRYLNEKPIAYAEKLAATFPDGLDVCLFVCTGTEANELALRIARTVTGNHGIVVMENAYHGNSTLIGETSTGTYPAENRPSHIEAVEPPNTYRGPFREGESDLGRKYADLIDPAIRKLQERGENVAAFMCDAIFDSQGVLEAPKDYFAHAYARIRAAGGLCISDEVQSGFLRTGTRWGFENFGVVPDIVTLGKPMGAGHPIGGVVVRREIAEAWMNSDVYFNTFGGNPVSAAVGMAVLDVLGNEHIGDNVRTTGAYLRTRLEELAEKHPLIGNVRGRGLFQAIELVRDHQSREPAPEITRLIPDAMKQQGVLLGLSGRFGNVIKIRPPLTFRRAHVDHLIRVLDKVLSEAGRTGPDETSRTTGFVHQGVLTEQMVAQYHKDGMRTLAIGRAVALTPLARERARKLSLRIERLMS